MLELDLTHPAPQPQMLTEAQSVIDALWSALGEALDRIAKLEEQRQADSHNTSKPPSSDSPKQRAERRRKPRSGRVRGAQPVHLKHERTRVEETEVGDIQRFLPADCATCGGSLELQTDPAIRHQVFELPEARYQVTEYQLYRGDCSHCQRPTTAQLPA